MYISLFIFILPVTYGWRFIPPPPNKNKPVIKVDTSKDYRFQGKPFISIKPYGIAGFYNLGTCNYLLDNYDLSEYSFIGQCSSSWNALLGVCNNNHTRIYQQIVELPIYNNPPSMSCLNYHLRDFLLSEYSSDDFDLERLYLCIGENPTKIMSNFLSLEHAIDCCIASCQTILSDSDYFFKLYQPHVSLDDELIFFPPKKIYTHYLVSPDRNYHLNESMFLEMVNKKIDPSVIKKLYHSGYQDSSHQKQYLDQVFKNKRFNMGDNYPGLYFPPQI